MRKKSILILLLFFCVNFVLMSQINTGEFPPSFYTQSEKSNQAIPIYQIEQPNLESLRIQDKADQAAGLKPWRFGALIPVTINLEEAGAWTDNNETGMSTWKLQIRATDAISINLNFEKFFLSDNAKLYFYNENYNDVLGAITSNNNKKDSLFSIRPIRGDLLTIELILPSKEIDQIEFELNELIYGYRNIHEKVQKVFNGSGNCNVNINCPDGKNWQDVKRSVALITTASNTRFCTGTLLNNVRQDTTPYFLSAAHCGIKNNSIFIFGYESANCTPSTDGGLSNSISGASPKAVSNSSQPDFHLFELSSRPPSSYNVFYSGWSANNVAVQQSTTIHHPTGDVKKISRNTDSLITSGYYDANGTTHWTVNNWEVGTTESGSSGAPLFDQNLRVIGQLHGGEAACGNNGQDYFGKFAESWNSNTTKSRQLKAWLDPDTTNVLVLDGLDPNPSNNNDDIQLLGIVGVPNYSCDTIIEPKINVRNKGNNQVDSIEISYQLDNNTVQTTHWTGRMLRNQVEQITIPSINISSGTHILGVEVSILPPTTFDQDTANNTSQFEFITNDQAIFVNLEIKTDDYGEETSWRINNSLGDKLFEEGPYINRNGGTIETNSLCLFSDCFDFILFDQFGDGFNGQFGNGYALITEANGDTLLFENSFTTAKKTINFCVSPITTIEESNKLRTSDLLAFPNPIKKNGLLSMKSKFQNSKNYSFDIIDASGRLRMTFDDEQVYLSENMTAGVYFLITKDSSGTQLNAQKLVVQ